jgi:hypothetical protein
MKMENTCVLCNKGYLDLKQHLSKEHAVRLVPRKTGKNSCGICGIRIDNIGYAVSHYQIKHPKQIMQDGQNNQDWETARVLAIERFSKNNFDLQRDGQSLADSLMIGLGTVQTWLCEYELKQQHPAPRVQKKSGCNFIGKIEPMAKNIARDSEILSLNTLKKKYEISTWGIYLARYLVGKSVPPSVFKEFSKAHKQLILDNKGEEQPMQAMVEKSGENKVLEADYKSEEIIKALQHLIQDRTTQRDELQKIITKCKYLEDENSLLRNTNSKLTQECDQHLNTIGKQDETIGTLKNMQSSLRWQIEGALSHKE